MTSNKYAAILGAGALSVAMLTGGVAVADDRAEVQMFLKSPHDIAAAIKAAEASAGGDAISASYDESRGSGYYEIDVATGGKLSEVIIDASSGQVIQTRAKGPDRDDATTADLTGLGGDLTALIAMIENETGAKVMSIDAENEGGRFAGMEIEVAHADGSTQDLLLNAADGKLIPSY